jgi:asparagine synthase (glutamine-hydrolysing)
MCGVVGWVDFERDLRSERAIAQALTDSLSRRGPDGDGLWLSPHAALGHRRLSVIDLAGGHQPMVASEDGRDLAVLTYCSEVYNFRELRAELAARGHRFRTAGDTEVVLRAYLEWGEGLAERLNGIFAFGVWDVRREELILVRDRLGVKPMYYYRTPAGVLFASEPKAILAHPDVPAAVDADGLRELLSLAKTPGEAVWQGMREVRPGEVIRIRRDGWSARRYWRLPAVTHADDLGTTVATVRELLTDAVARQTVADVPMGILLSGGLDSSVVTVLADRALREQGAGAVRTFGLDFAGYTDNFHPEYMRETPDAPFIAELAAHVGSTHTDIVLSTGDLTDPAARAEVLRALDLPNGRGDRDTSLYLLTRAVAGECTAALTGESADEVFGGYWWFHEPGAVSADTFPWLPMFGHVVDDGPDSATSLLDVDLLKALDLPGYRDARYREALAEVPHLPGVSAAERRMREICYLTLTRLMPLLLDRMDRLSMAAPLEVRVPFCDHRLVEYVFGVPWAMKSFDGREKSLLRAATADLLPASIAERRKAPFPAVQDVGYEQWLRSELGTVVADRSRRVNAFLNVKRAGVLAAAPVGTTSANETRSTIELVLRLDEWLRRYDVRLSGAD